jgi:hypothetical protein
MHVLWDLVHQKFCEKWDKSELFCKNSAQVCCSHFLSPDTCPVIPTMLSRITVFWKRELILFRNHSAPRIWCEKCERFWIADGTHSVLTRVHYIIQFQTA